MKTARTALLILLVLLVAVSVLAAPQARAGGKAGSAKPSWWGPPPGQVPAVQGTVTRVAPDQVTLDTKRGPQTFAVTAETKVRIRGNQGTIADVRVGDPCRVVFQPVQNGTPVARRIRVLKPHAAGEIVAIEGNVLTLKQKGKDTTWTVTVPETAKIMCRKYQGTLADLRIGYWAAATGEISGSAVTAQAVAFRPTVYKGTVTEINGSQITVKTIRQNMVTGLVGEKTQILVRPRVGPNKPGTLSDIQVGAPVNIGGHLMEGAPMQLIFVDVLMGM